MNIESDEAFVNLSEMKDHTKEYHNWLSDNNVIVYNRSFEYKGVPFNIEKKGTKFYCTNISTGFVHKAWPTKTMAVYWACKNTI